MNITKKIAQDITHNGLAIAKNKWSDYSILMKYRLNLTVVFSSVVGYVLAVGSGATFLDLFLLGLSGFLITGSANAINQILEKEYDKLMKRTKNRPLAAGRMNVPEAALVAGLTGVIGVGILGYAFNELAALIGALSLLIYAFVYTPLKRISPIAVFAGAIPGALPPLIGWVAATSILGYEAWVLFAIQFLWQFPHFWAIGWLGAEEYKKAGYKLMPSEKGRSKETAIWSILYIVVLLPVSILPILLNMVTWVSGAVAIIGGLGFLYAGIRLYQQCTEKAALHLMLASITYLPIVQLTMALDKVFLGV